MQILIDSELKIIVSLAYFDETLFFAEINQIQMNHINYHYYLGSRICSFLVFSHNNIILYNIVIMGYFRLGKG